MIEAVAGRRDGDRELDRERGDAPVLSDEEVAQLAELGRRIEEHYGSPQDTEWAFDSEGRVCMLQSRPVTPPGARPANRPGTGRSSSRPRGGARARASAASG